MEIQVAQESLDGLFPQIQGFHGFLDGDGSLMPMADPTVFPVFRKFRDFGIFRFSTLSEFPDFPVDFPTFAGKENLLDQLLDGKKIHGIGEDVTPKLREILTLWPQQQVTLGRPAPPSSAHLPHETLQVAGKLPVHSGATARLPRAKGRRG